MQCNAAVAVPARRELRVRPNRFCEATPRGCTCLESAAKQHLGVGSQTQHRVCAPRRSESATHYVKSSASNLQAPGAEEEAAAEA